MEQLKRMFAKMDGKGYKAYKELQGKIFHFPDYDLIFHYVQGDPFASPSQVTIKVPQKTARFPRATFHPKIRTVALADYLSRSFHRAIQNTAKGRRGTGKSGLFQIDHPGQEVLERSCIEVNDNFVAAHILVGLPARGRTVLGNQATFMFLEELPVIVSESLLFEALPRNPLIEHIKTVEDQEALRQELTRHKLVAFIANGSLLPRRSGVDQRPLTTDRTVLFQAPPSLEIKLKTPHAGPLKGMAIPEGITLIVGGGYHGKSTLLRALERSVYNHIPGDGRHQVVTDARAFKIRAEDGRRVEKVNISPFINNLPLNQHTFSFSSQEASGSTSQAANIVEALEVGACVLLIDEDTSATNFMIRDPRMQRLVSREKEPITPFIDKVQQLHRHLNISSVIVLGGSGDYFDVADTVIMMDEYHPRDVTKTAHKIAAEMPNARRFEGGDTFGCIQSRIPLPHSLNPKKGQKVKIKAHGDEKLQFGHAHIDLHYVEQLVNDSQTRAIGDLLFFALKEAIIDGRTPLNRIVHNLDEVINNKGLNSISPFSGRPGPQYARPRPLEIAAAINRVRTLAVK